MRTSFKNLKICIASCFPPPTGGVATQALMLAEHLSMEGAVIYRLRDFHHLWEIPQWIVRGIKILKNCDVVHILAASYKAFYRASLTILLAKLFNKHIVLMSEGETDEFLRKRGFFVKPILKLVDVIAVYSGFLEEIYKKYGFEPIIIPDFISDIFIYRNRNPIKPVILMTKSLSPEYNYICALKSFMLILTKFPSAKLIIAGKDRSDKNNIVNFIKNNKIRNITFLGEIEYSKMPEIYNEADILLNTTNTDNFPRCILEAFASGLVVVATKVGGIPYMIKDGINGLLVEPNNPLEVSQKIIYLLDNPAISSNISENARKIFEENYTWNKVKSKLLWAYTW